MYAFVPIIEINSRHKRPFGVDMTRSNWVLLDNNTALIWFEDEVKHRNVIKIAEDAKEVLGVTSRSEIEAVCSDSKSIELGTSFDLQIAQMLMVPPIDFNLQQLRWKALRPSIKRKRYEIWLGPNGPLWTQFQMPSKHSKTFADNFNRSGNLDGSTSSDSNFTWLEVDGTEFTTNGTQCDFSPTTEQFNTARANADLDTDDHYVEIDRNSFNIGSTSYLFSGIIVRFTGGVGYSLEVGRSPGPVGLRIIKRYDNDASIVEDSTYTTADIVMRLEVDGSSLTAKIDGSTILGPATNTAFSGQLRCGIAAYRSDNGFGFLFDNFECGDLVAGQQETGNVDLSSRSGLLSAFRYDAKVSVSMSGISGKLARISQFSKVNTSCGGQSSLDTKIRANFNGSSTISGNSGFDMALAKFSQALLNASGKGDLFADGTEIGGIQSESGEFDFSGNSGLLLQAALSKNVSALMGSMGGFNIISSNILGGNIGLSSISELLSGGKVNWNSSSLIFGNSGLLAQLNTVFNAQCNISGMGDLLSQIRANYTGVATIVGMGGMDARSGVVKRSQLDINGMGGLAGAISVNRGCILLYGGNSDLYAEAVGAAFEVANALLSGNSGLIALAGLNSNSSIVDLSSISGFMGVIGVQKAVSAFISGEGGLSNSMSVLRSSELSMGGLSALLSLARAIYSPSLLQSGNSGLDATAVGGALEFGTLDFGGFSDLLASAGVLKSISSDLGGAGGLDFNPTRIFYPVLNLAGNTNLDTSAFRAVGGSLLYFGNSDILLDATEVGGINPESGEFDLSGRGGLLANAKILSQGVINLDGRSFLLVNTALASDAPTVYTRIVSFALEIDRFKEFSLDIDRFKEFSLDIERIISR